MRSWVISKNVGVISSEPNAVVLLYDLTSTYFEGEAAGVESAARGYSRDHRPDTLQVIVALVVTAEGFPVAYEVFERGHGRRDDAGGDRFQDREQVWNEGSGVGV